MLIWSWANECKFIEIQRHRSIHFLFPKIIVKRLLRFKMMIFVFIMFDKFPDYATYIEIKLLYFRLRMNAGYK